MLSAMCTGHPGPPRSARCGGLHDLLKSGQRRLDPGDRLFHGHVLPEAEHRPPTSAQTCIGQTISFHITVELRTPVVSVRFRPCAVPRTAMPETAVDEDGEPGPCKHDVGSNRSVRGNDPGVLAEAMASAMQQRSHPAFGCGIGTAIRAHARPGCRCCGRRSIRCP